MSRIESRCDDTLPQHTPVIQARGDLVKHDPCNPRCPRWESALERLPAAERAPYSRFPAVIR